MKLSLLLRLAVRGVGAPSLRLLRAVRRGPSGALPAKALAGRAAAKGRASVKSASGKKRSTSPLPSRAVNASGASSKLSLADFHPAIARTWIAAASNKMLQPRHVAPDSCKLVWWICPACQHQHNKRIDLHLAAGGACPKCHAKPTLDSGSATGKDKAASSSSAAATTASASSRKGKGKSTSSSSALTLPATVDAAVFQHRCRPDSARGTIAAENANRLSKSVADDQYLRVQETRNLLPMLAKNFEKERWKIAEDEVLQVSPKLDGIRCVVAYRVDTKQVLFFSRSGTLFECCDHAIEPALRCLFEKDPSLVLDGELYNDSVNMAQLAAAQEGREGRRKGGSSSGADVANAGDALAFYGALVRAGGVAASAAAASASSSSTTPKSKRQAKGNVTSAKPAIIRFEQLTSAIRTTRQRLTPEIAALQRQLQYHVFDVLYSREFPSGRGAAVAFTTRYAVLERLLATATAHNLRHLPGYNPLVLRRVPSYACTSAAVDTVLHAAMRVGYEGVMIRRESRGNTADGASAKLESAKSKLKRAAAAGATGGRGTEVHDGGYGYGERSSTLLKYKVMQDAEYVIVGAVEGAGKWQGSLGSFICVTADEKHRFTVTPASTDADKRRMWRSWKTAYRGKALTVQYQELTPDGVPRFPVGKSVRGAADGHDWL